MSALHMARPVKAARQDHVAVIGPSAEHTRAPATGRRIRDPPRATGAAACASDTSAFHRRHSRPRCRTTENGLSVARTHSGRSPLHVSMLLLLHIISACSCATTPPPHTPSKDTGERSLRQPAEDARHATFVTGSEAHHIPPSSRRAHLAALAAAWTLRCMWVLYPIHTVE